MFKASPLDNFETLSERIIQNANKHNSGDPWKSNDDFIIKLNDKQLKNYSQRLEDVPGLIVNGKVTFKVEKVYPGGGGGGGVYR